MRDAGCRVGAMKKAALMEPPSNHVLKLKLFLFFFTKGVFEEIHGLVNYVFHLVVE